MCRGRAGPRWAGARSAEYRVRMERRMRGPNPPENTDPQGSARVRDASLHGPRPPTSEERTEGDARQYAKAKLGGRSACRVEPD